MNITSAGQTVLVVQAGPGKVVSFSATDPSQRKVIDVGQMPCEIELTPDGRTAFVSNFGLSELNHHVETPGTTISALDVERDYERTKFYLPTNSTAPHGLKLRPPKYRKLFTNTEEGTEGMVVFDAISGVVIRTFTLPCDVHNFIFNSVGTALFAYTTTGDLVRIDPDHGTVLASAKIAATRGLAWTADNRVLIVGSYNELLFLNPIDLSASCRFSDPGVGQIFYPAVTPDGRWIFASALLDGILLAIDAKTGAVEHRIETSSPLQVIPDRERVWASNILVPASMLGIDEKPRSGGVVLLDLITLTLNPIFQIPDANGIAVLSVAGLSEKTQI
jgi:DNA-binding beta-propeller fold protein YncE